MAEFVGAAGPRQGVRRRKRRRKLGEPRCPFLGVWEKVWRERREERKWRRRERKEEEKEHRRRRRRWWGGR